jgi:hypothetical protein
MRFEFESEIVSFCFSFFFVSFGESRLLVSWCAGDRCGMVCSDEDRGWSRRPGAEDQGWSYMSGTWWSGDREVGWRRVRSAPCTWSLASKPAATVFSSLASKLVVMVSPGLASKTVVGFLVEPQNQGGGGFLGLGLKTDGSSLVIWA